MLFPIASFENIPEAECNDLLVRWHHRMGPLNRPFPSRCFALYHEGTAVAVVTHSPLISTHVGGGLSELTRENALELSRLCACRPGLCRVAIRMWREFVFPQLGAGHAISYQDADLHNGNTYRFDGWQREGYSSSGTDTRSGLRGRNKWIWVWPPMKNHEQTTPTSKTLPLPSATAVEPRLADQAALPHQTVEMQFP